MTPHPPDLTTELTKWQPAELFTIVRHGVLFTGMPAWPSDHREDEVWAVVAFLQKFPEMKEHEYDDLSGRTLRDSVREAVRAPVDRPAELAAPQPPMVVIERCVACHAADGLGREAHPKLAGQSAEYLRASLDAYRQAARHSGTMGPIAVDLSDAEIEQSVSYYHSLAPFQPSASERTNKQRANEEPIAADDRLALGLEIATNGLLKEKAGACRECHGPGDAQRHARYPHLAGQDQDYLVQQLRLFRSNDRGGSDHAHIMHNIAESLSDEQISAVAAYYAALAIEPVEAANIPPRTTD